MASIMGESGDIFFPKLDEEGDMIPFDEIALDLLKTLGLTPDICQSEDEAREKALLLNLSSSPPLPPTPSTSLGPTLPVKNPSMSSLPQRKSLIIIHLSTWEL